MSLCGYNPRAFKIENGTLYVRDFCGEWVAIGEIGSTAKPEIDDTLTWPEESEYSACGKAGAIVDLIKSVSEYIWDQRDNDPVTAWTNVNALFPGIMSMGYTLNAVLAAVEIQVAQAATDGWYGPDLFDESTWQAILCALAAKLDDTETLPDKDKLFDMVVSLIDAQWPLDILAQTFYYNVLKAIGANDIRNQGLGGATDTARDCGCPYIYGPGTSFPTENGWYLSQEYVARVYCTGAYNTKLCNKVINTHEAFGVVYTLTWDEPDAWDAKRMSATSAGCTTYSLSAWGDTSDHLEYEAQGHKFACGHADVLDELLGSGNYTQQSSAYGEDTDPATGGVAAGNVITHGYYGDDMETGKYFEVSLRLIYNKNSPSHA